MILPNGTRYHPKETPYRVIGIASSALITIVLAGCFGGGSDSSSDSTEESSITEENKGHVALMARDAVYSANLGRFGENYVDGTSGVAIHASQSRNAVNEGPQQCITSGTKTYTESGDESSVIFESCEAYAADKITGLDGAVSMKLGEINEESSKTRKIEFARFEVYSRNTASESSSIYDGTHRTDRNLTEIETNISVDSVVDIDCVGGSYRSEGHQNLTVTVTPEGGGINVTTVKGDIVEREDTPLQGSWAIETVEPIRREVSDFDLSNDIPIQGAVQDYSPFSGEILVTAEDGSTVSVKYVESGIYVGNRFYTVNDFESEYRPNHQSELECFTGNDTDQPSKPGTIAEGMSAVIDGEAWSTKGDELHSSAWIISDAGPVGDALIISGVHPSTPGDRSVTLQIQGFTAPGSYEIGNSLAADGFGQITLLRDNMIWHTVYGGSGTVIVEDISENRVRGIFSFAAEADPRSDATGTIAVTDGEFDLALEQ